MFNRRVDRPVRMLLATVLVTAPLLAVATLIFGGVQVTSCLAPLPGCDVHPGPIPLIGTSAGVTAILVGLASCWLLSAVLLLAGLWRRRPELVLRLVGGVFMLACVAAVVGFGYGWQMTGSLTQGALDAAWFALATMVVLFVMGVAIAALLTPQRRRNDLARPVDPGPGQWERRSSG